MRLRPKITLAVFFVSALVSLLLAIFLYRFIDRQLAEELKTRLRDIASIGSHAIDLEAYERLRASIDPLLDDAAVRRVERSADFRRVFDQLNMIRDTEPELIRYVYILAPTEDPNVGRFVVDPEFKVRSVSGYFPLGGSAGSCLGVLGVDITDKNMRAALDAAGSLAVKISLVAIVLALLVSVVMGTLLTKSVLASHGLPGRVQASEATYSFLEGSFDFEPRGTIDVKGKGPMKTYLLVGERERSSRPGPPAIEA